MAKRKFIIEPVDTGATKFSLALDSQGNACLSANGIEIFYVAEEDGRGYAMTLDDADQEKLPNLAINDDRLHIMI